MLVINEKVSLADEEIELNAIRSQGAGGQNVNKVATAIHLRFDIAASSLPDVVKNRLLERNDQRITTDGIIVIKAQSARTQEKNRQDALARLSEIISSALIVPAKRIPTRPGRTARKKRTDEKKKRGELKKLRSKPY